MVPALDGKTEGENTNREVVRTFLCGFRYTPHHMDRSRALTWQYGVVGVGALLVAAAFLPPVFRDPETGATVLSNPFRFLLTVGPGGLVAVLGIHLGRFRVDDDLFARIFAWCVTGTAIFVFIIVLIAGMSYYSQGTADVSGFSFQLAAGVGAVTGTVVGVQETRTITREREAARERAAAAAAETERENLAFLNNLLRHHVLNGFQIIRGNAEVLREGHDPECATTIVERSDAVAALVRNVRTLVDADATERSRDRVDLSVLLRREVATLQESYPGAAVETDVPDGLVVVADSLLSAVFENLLRNAVEHNDTAVSRVTVAAEAVEERVRVRITDDGPGIEDVSEAFEPGDSGSRGIGLHLVRTLVSRYDGAVTVDSDGDGTAVEVTLPAPADSATLQPAAVTG